MTRSDDRARGSFPRPLAALLDHFAPAGADPQLLRRSRLLVAISIVLCLFGIPFAVRMLVTVGHVDTTFVSFIVGALVLGANPVLLKRTGKLTVPAWLLCSELMLVLGVQAYSNGGIGSASLQWNVVVPLIAMTLLGHRAALICAVIVGVEALAFYFLGNAGVRFPQPLDAVQMRWWLMAGLVSVPLFVAAFGAVHEASRRGAMTVAEDALRDLVAANDALGKARDLAEHHAKVKAEFLANMSHEIRTPLNAVVGMSDMLSATQLTEDQRDMAHIISSGGSTLLALVNDILDLSKIDAGELVLESRPVDVRACVEGTVLRASKAAADKGISLESEVGAGVPRWVLSDMTRLTQIITNLISNAIKFTERGGVEVRVSSTPSGVDRARLQVCVRDTGIGIPSGRIDAMFDAFKQADTSTTRKYGGTGLGLAIVKRLVDELGGTVEVDSEVDRGSRFCVVFEAAVHHPDGAGVSTSPPPPIVQGRAPTTASGDHPVAVLAESAPVPRVVAQPASVPSRLRLLLAEDNIVNQRVATAMLRHLGYEADVVENGREVLRALEERDYDVLLMDVQMPEMDGLEASRELRRRHHTPFIVAMTANALEGDRQRCLDAGMNDYITKPVRKDVLRRMLERCEQDLALPARPG